MRRRCSSRPCCPPRAPEPRRRRHAARRLLHSNGRATRPRWIAVQALLNPRPSLGGRTASRGQDAFPPDGDGPALSSGGPRAPIHSWAQAALLLFQAVPALLPPLDQGRKEERCDPIVVIHERTHSFRLANRARAARTSKAVHGCIAAYSAEDIVRGGGGQSHEGGASKVDFEQLAAREHRAALVPALTCLSQQN